MAATRKRASVSRGLQAGRTGLEGVREPGPARRPYTKRDLGVIYRALIEAYGPQQWWPTAAEDGPEQRFEICLGAILVQNTAWRGAANALANLRGADATTPEAILDLPEPVLGELLRPSGYFNAKARKVRAFCEAPDAPAWIVSPLWDGEGALDPRLSARTWSPKAPYVEDLSDASGRRWRTARRYAVIPCRGA